MKIATRRTWSVTGLSCIAALAGGCSKFEATTETGLSVRGYYVGQLKQQIGASTRILPAVVIGSDIPGHVQIATVDGLEQLDLDINDSVAQADGSQSFVGGATVYETEGGDFNGLNPVLGNGQVEAEGLWRPSETLHATFHFTNGDDTLDVTYRGDIYEQATSLAQIAGSWRQDGENGFQLNMTLDSAGEATGVDNHGCPYVAHFRALTDDGASVDWFHVDETAGCGRALSGVAALVRSGVNGNPSDRLVVLTTSDDVGAARGFLRQ